jgi:hypothetical protein
VTRLKQAEDHLRVHLVRLLDWEDAHINFDSAVNGIPSDKRGSLPPGFTHSLWQLLEHMRIAQQDLLDFCVNPQYAHNLKWPDDYWPKTPAPPEPGAWDASLREFRADREKLKQLVRNTEVDLFAIVPTGKDKQTYVRAILLVADHNAYHLGQFVSLRRTLGLWRL